MTVAELIELLKTKPQDMLVGYALYSEYCLMEIENIRVLHLCEPRNDGWLHSPRPDKPNQAYLIFPGN